jgi:hypothetical protein
MRTKPVAALCVALAATVMALGVTTAAARNFSVGNQNFRWTFSNLEFEAAGVTDTCRVTLEGSLHARTIAKVAGSLLGYITRVTTGQCSQGTTILNETLPWHLRYEGFSGRLPNITLIIGSMSTAVRIMTCLGSFALRVAISVGFPQIILVIFENHIFALTGFLCPETGTAQSGIGQDYQQGSTTRVSISLI